MEFVSHSLSRAWLQPAGHAVKTTFASGLGREWAFWKEVSSGLLIGSIGKEAGSSFAVSGQVVNFTERTHIELPRNLSVCRDRALDSKHHRAGNSPWAVKGMPSSTALYNNPLESTGLALK